MPPVTTLPSGLLEELATGVLVTDDVGTVLAVNQIAARTLGYAPEALRGSNIVVLAPQLEAPARGPVKPEDVQRRRLRHKAGHRVLAERRTRARDGLVVYLLDERPTVPPAPSLRRESAEQLRVVADAVPALLAYLDAEARYAWVNESYQRWFGAPPESVCGRPCQEVLGPAAWEAIRPHVERVLAGEEVTFEDRVLYKSGPARDIRASYIPHRDADGRVCGFVALVNDISEIRAAEAALCRSEHMLEQSQSTAHVGSWEATFREGDRRNAEVRWSTETYRIFGHVPGAVQPTQDLFYGSIHPEDREGTRATAAAGIQQGGPFEKEYRIVRPDGSIRILHSWIRIEHDAAGKPIRMLGTVQDVTERNRELQEADRRKDEFLAMLAHELRNPLAPILNAVEILDNTRPEQQEITGKFRAVIARQVQHMKRLLDDLLDVSRVSQGKIQLRTERVELAELLAQAVEVSRPVLAEKRHQLAVTPAAAPLPLEADPTRLVQVFANIINNAAKYTDAGGRISITTAIEGNEAVVTVGDDGMGMSRELLVRAFDLFVQETRSLDRAQGGLGIGLTMVRTLVRLHGGSVQAFSDGPGRGTSLVVRLPLVAVRATAAGEPLAALAALATSQGELRVLVVDDNVDAAQALGRLLELLGHRVTMAYDGAVALAAADALRPDLVLLDISLPGMDGYTVAARLRDAGHRDATLVALTGYGQEDHLRRSTEAGFDHHLVKPVDFASLRQITVAVRRDTADG